MWLVQHNWCWTSDRLATRGMDHPECCLLCEQEDENINHLLFPCVFAKQFWDDLLRAAGLHELFLQAEASFEDWWRPSCQRVEGLARKGFNSLVILGAWSIWKHGNRCVFDDSPPSVVVALQMAREEALVWTMVGARGLSSLQYMVGVG
jgi:hypothetical protein